MDSELPERVIRGRKRKVLVWVAAGLLAIFGGVWVIRYSLTPAVKKSKIGWAVVDKGDIENTINASGEVLPEFEEILTSPISASIQKVLLEAGSSVKGGQSVLTLDKSASQLDDEKLQFQLASKRNSIQKLKLELDKSFYDLQSNNDIKQLRINSLEAAVENAKKLFTAGGGTREDIQQAELNLQVARLEKKQLENEIRNKQQTMQADMRESTIAAEIQENDLRVLERKLKLADLVASRPGVVTWVNANIGAVVHEGESLARIADLESFKVTGSLSDNYIDQLHQGMYAIVRVNETQLRGTVNHIFPSIQNGIISFDIQLNERNNKLLRPNMKVEVYLVTSMHKNVMRTANGPAFKGSAIQDIFVLEKGRAHRRRVHIGLMNFDFVEILDNVTPGEVIINSDMGEFKNSNEIEIVN